ncbi:MAG TPA: hypothetical protein VN541_19050 [Tepidisphaeraceae bacterium]|nr:hypothetical protein [Tepidisphaeraceae bacterium]
MHENTAVPMSVAAKLTQFISELYVLWGEEKPITAPQAALREIFTQAVSRNGEAPAKNPEAIAQNDEPMEANLELPAEPLTKRGTPRMSREEIAARRKAVWTPEKRAEHRRRTLERMARDRQQPRIPQSIPA